MKKEEFDRLINDIKNCNYRNSKLKISIYNGNRELYNDDDYVLTDEGGLLLVDALKFNPYITELDLSHTDITDKTVLALTTVSTLKKIDLYETNVQSAGVIALTSMGLEYLSIGESLLMHDTLDQKTKVINALITNKTIKELNLACTVRNEELIEKLIKENDTITDLHIDSNRITDKTLKSLVLNNTLKYLDISQNNGITDQGIDYLISSPSLETVYMLSSESITLSGLYKFIGSNFKKVNFFNNRVSWQDQEQFEKNFQEALLKKMQEEVTSDSDTTDTNSQINLSGDVDLHSEQGLTD